MIKQSSQGPAVKKAQEVVEAYQTDRKNETVAELTTAGRWVQAATPPAPRWK